VFSFPKEARLLRRSDFRRVYDEGFRVSGPYFAAVCNAVERQARARVGFAVPKALGGSVIRNRLKRRLREAVRLYLGQLGPQWNVVLQARKPALTAAFADLSREVQRVFSRCAPSS
jgi:ribonuclease P protein component